MMTSYLNYTNYATITWHNINFRPENFNFWKDYEDIVIFYDENFGNKNAIKLLNILTGTGNCYRFFTCRPSKEQIYNARLLIKELK